MKQVLFYALAVSCFAVSTANAEVVISFSTSSTNASEGTVLNLKDGEMGSLFVWAENNDASGKIIDGLSLDVTGAGSSLLTASSFDIVNGGRWLLGSTPGTLGVSPGLLVDDSNAGTFNIGPTSGIRNGAAAVLYATLNFNAVGVGSNTLGFAAGNREISVEGLAPDSLRFGNATVKVVAAVPEPGSLILLGSLVGAAFLRRRRT